VIAGEAANASETMIAVRELCSDVLLLDIRLLDRSGLDVCPELKSAPGGPRILFVTSFADNELVLAAIQPAEDGYLLKDNTPRQIVKALRTVMSGGAIFDPVATRHAVSGMRQELNSPKDLLDSLSAQELRVPAAVAAGQTDKEAATNLGLQAKTVRNYLELEGLTAVDHCRKTTKRTRRMIVEKCPHSRSAPTASRESRN
jgi:two-component system response regulator DevR